MAATQAIGASEAGPADIPVRRITPDDLRASLRDGWADFSAHRGDILFIGILYPLIGIVTAALTLRGDAMPLLFPLAAGLSLLGPLVSTGFYELARRQEAGQESDWSHFFDIVRKPSFGAIMFVGLILVALFVAWLIAAGLVYEAFLGPRPPASLGDFLTRLFTTSSGWAMMIVGDLIGLGFAIVVLMVSVVSLPMLVDRNVDAGTAIMTSVRAVRDNPAVMARWGLIVAVLLVLGSIPAFIGLAVVLPVLGYATWHLYTRTVEREPARLPE